MAGSYGWKVDDVESQVSETENIRMPMPYVEESSEAPGLDFSHPQVKGCCFCCCTKDEDEKLPHPGGDQGNVDKDPRGYSWFEYNGSIPQNAIKAGVDADGSPIYVGRTIYQGELQPAKVMPNDGSAYISYAGEEVCVNEFEILCRGAHNIVWQECRDGAVPPDAVVGGATPDDEKLYIGRVFHEGMRIPGKVHPSHGCCYIAYGGAELSFPVYEVLVAAL